jgi:hypothetical protein
MEYWWNNIDSMEYCWNDIDSMGYWWNDIDSMGTGGMILTAWVLVE